MEVNTNQLANYQSYSNITFEIESKELVSTLPTDSFVYGNLTLQVEGDTLVGSYEYEEAIYLEPLENTTIPNYITSILELPLKHWIEYENEEILINCVELIRTLEISKFHIIDQEIVVDGPGSSIIEYCYDNGNVVKTSLTNFDSNIEDVLEYFYQEGNVEEFKL